MVGGVDGEPSPAPPQPASRTKANTRATRFTGGTVPQDIPAPAPGYLAGGASSVLEVACVGATSTSVV